MQIFKLALLLYISYIPLNTFSMHVHIHTFPSIIQPETEKTILLPFPYRGLNEQDKKDTTLILESRFIVLEKNSTRKALVGPLSPCHLIALTNGNKTIIFHYSLANKIKQVCQLAQDVLKPEPSSSKNQISGLIFANLTIPPDRSARLKRDQTASIKKIKDTLVKKLGIKNPNQIREVGFSFGAACDENNEKEYRKYLDHYELANRYILINEKLETYCTAPRKEDFFNTAADSNEPFFAPQNAASAAVFYKKMFEAFTKNNAELCVHKTNTLNLLDIDTFVKEDTMVIPKEETIDLKEIRAITQKENDVKETNSKSKHKTDRLRCLDLHIEQENIFPIKKKS